MSLGAGLVLSAFFLVTLTGTFSSRPGAISSAAGRNLQLQAERKLRLLGPDHSRRMFAAGIIQRIGDIEGMADTFSGNHRARAIFYFSDERTGRRYLSGHGRGEHQERCNVFHSDGNE